MRCSNCDKKVKQAETTGVWYHSKAPVTVNCYPEFKAAPKRRKRK